MPRTTPANRSWLSMRFAWGDARPLCSARRATSLSHRYHQRGYSRTEFVLRLTREDIGSYLGLKLETISRLLSRFQAMGLLQVQGRVVKLLDLPALKEIAGHHCA